MFFGSTRDMNLTRYSKIFAKTPDPDYEENLLFEQHQAPITAALTPAFSSDSTPEILASAIGTCATFVGCGVVKDVGRMGRILKLLTSALEQSKGNHNALGSRNGVECYHRSWHVDLGRRC